MRRNKQKSDFTQYIKFLKSVMNRVDKVSVVFVYLMVFVDIKLYLSNCFLRWMYKTVNR